MTDPAPAAPIPQRLVLVLPTTAEFDSRTYRVASSAARRGHAVTVLARWAPGLAREELHPSGYRIVRVPVSPVDGLPLPPPVRRAIARRLRGGTAGSPAADDASTTGGRATTKGGTAQRTIVGRVRRAWAATVRIVAIVLVVRAQTRASRRVDPGADVYHAMAYMGIPVALDLARRSGGRVIYDARDIYVDANNLARLPGPLRRVLARLERGWARRADAVVTVNRPYAEVMASRWDLPLPRIVMNCAYRRDPVDPPVRRFHELLALDPATAVVLYHGGLGPERGIEQLFEAILLVPDAVLVLLGYGPGEAAYRSRAADPALAGRVHVLPAVPPTELLDWVAAADVVAMPIQPTTLNHRLTTPNKLFEALAVGVPVVASDLPGMAGVVRDTGCGLLVDPADPAAIAAAIREILEASPEERRGYRDRALHAAHSTYNWESQAEHLFDLYSQLTGFAW
ncbi:MAG TPA: glycosyltransferase [Candidatus Acidoferrum sp.]|nr:glycosyltransferase [Candidatus Acidoferrum sp.]